MITFFLEHVFSLVCFVVVSHLGKKELGAVSLATMTSNIIFAVFDGLSTVLDTLCPQAFGAGDFNAVGVHLQRCSLLGMVLFVPFGLIWWFSDKLLAFFVGDAEVLHLTSTFLKIMIWGAPGYILFENLKRYLQAQGIFEAGTYVLLICAPINVLLTYLLVWNKYIGVGFIGAPIAVIINFWMMFLFLVGYTSFIDGSKCWNGMSTKAFTRWKELIHLAIPGIVMLEAESISYEVLTLFASSFGTSYLATQSAVSTIASLFYMSSFSIGIASSTRIANFVGAKRIDCAKLSTKVGIISSVIMGIISGASMIIFRVPFANLFSKDEEVIQMIVDIFPLIGFISIFDSINAVSGCCLRGQGMQRVGGFINLFAYYVVGLPLTWYFGFYLDYKLKGLWYGMFISFLVIGIWQSLVVLDADWNKIVEEADDRKEDDEQLI
jgi:MATE family multidrug resistance protein